MSYQKIISQRLQKLISNLSQDFDLSKLSKSPARFSKAKLNWFNQEYIKKLSLSEFCYRASKLKLDKRNPLKKFGVGDYVLLIDIDKQKVFGVKCENEKWLGENNFFPIGGRREDGLTSLENLKKESLEETNNQLQIIEDKLLKIATFEVENEVMSKFDLDGKEFNLYFYAVNVEDLQPCQELENGKINQSDWFDLVEIIETGKYINYPIWQEFCKNNNLTCFEPSLAILQQYLAWNLDKNRVTTLSEVG